MCVVPYPFITFLPNKLIPKTVITTYGQPNGFTVLYKQSKGKLKTMSLLLLAVFVPI